jgi:hypothetical protein
MTPLMYCCHPEGSVECAQALLKAGATVDDQMVCAAHRLGRLRRAYQGYRVLPCRCTRRGRVSGLPGRPCEGGQWCVVYSKPALPLLCR